MGECAGYNYCEITGPALANTHIIFNIHKHAHTLNKLQHWLNHSKKKKKTLSDDRWQY